MTQVIQKAYHLFINRRIKTWPTAARIVFIFRAKQSALAAGTVVKTRVFIV
ncbi:Uncharacterised protein [Vibrio cholerae]|nr:Uncharacterised protein [Vibrio cholerae]